MIKLIVAGSRTITDKTTVYKLIEDYISDLPKDQSVEIVSGMARGVDDIAANFAVDKNYPARLFPADWEESPKGAGYIRNNKMAEYGTHLLAFWDGESKGTQHMIEIAKEKGLDVTLIGMWKGK